MSERILSETRGQSQVIWPFTNYLTRGSFGDFADDFAGIVCCGPFDRDRWAKSECGSATPLAFRSSLVRNLVNFVGDVGVLKIPADTHTLGLVSALPEKRQRLVRRRLAFWKPLRQVHVTIGTTGKLGRYSVRHSGQYMGGRISRRT